MELAYKYMSQIPPKGKKKFDEEFDRIFKKEKKKGGDSKVLNGDSRV